MNARTTVHRLGGLLLVLLIAGCRATTPAPPPVAVAVTPPTSAPPATPASPTIRPAETVTAETETRPGQSAPATARSTTAVPQRVDARTVVQAAIDGWTTMPTAGTLHRRVWARDPRPGSGNRALVTEVWLPSAGDQYRVETTHDDMLTEWHVVDRSGQLHTAAEPVYNMCHWSYGPNVWLVRHPLTFDVPAEKVQAVRDARLQSGAYGAGYHLLRRAVHAPDLHSYGMRTDNGRALLTVGFRDGATTPARLLLFVIDARTNELHAVRELAGDAAQATAHDLWRVDVHETVATLPTALPQWDGSPQRRSAILDPACPDLQRSAVYSVRTIAATSGPVPSREWGAKYVPMPLPSHVTQAAFISGGSEDPNSGRDPSFANLVLRSADGWLHLSMSLEHSAPTADDLRRGAWLVRVNSENDATNTLDATLWPELDDAPGFYWVFDVKASGWTREQLLETVARLQPVNARTWPALAPRFLDPEPLPADVERVLVDAQQALAALTDGAYHVIMDATTRADPSHATGSASVDVPVGSSVPHAWTVEQWTTIRDSVPVQFKQVATAADGTLLSAYVDAAGRSTWYDALASARGWSAYG